MYVSCKTESLIVCKFIQTVSSFLPILLYQEELAFMMEMLGLKEDALIQYDELEAMFDQFIENYASGGMLALNLGVI